MLQVKQAHYYFIFLTFAVLSCGPKTLFESSQSIPNPWPYQKPCQFDFDVQDTSKAYDLNLVVDHDSDFGYENMYVLTTTTFPDGKKVEHPLSLQFSGQDSHWIGDCHGDQCSIDISLSQHAFYKKVGKYSIRFEQYSRQDTIRGIKSMTLRITESE